MDKNDTKIALSRRNNMAVRVRREHRHRAEAAAGKRDRLERQGGHPHPTRSGTSTLLDERKRRQANEAQA